MKYKDKEETMLDFDYSKIVSNALDTIAEEYLGELDYTVEEVGDRVIMSVDPHVTGEEAEQAQKQLKALEESLRSHGIEVIDDPLMEWAVIFR